MMHEELASRCFVDFSEKYRNQRITQMERDEFLALEFLQGWEDDIAYFQKLLAVRDLVVIFPDVSQRKQLLPIQLTKLNRVRELCLGLRPITKEDCPLPVIESSETSSSKLRSIFQKFKKPEKLSINFLRDIQKFTFRQRARE